MKKFDLSFLIVVALSAMLTACDSGKESPVKHEESGEAPTNRIDIPGTVRNNLGITFAKVERRNIANTVRVPGSFELRPLARREYRMMVPGNVQLEVDQFDKVHPGQLLYRFSSREWLKMQANIDLMVASLEQVRAKHEAGQERVAALAQAKFKRADLEADIAVLRADLIKQEAELQAALSKAAKLLNHHGSSSEGATLKPEQLLAEVNGISRYRSIDWIEVHAAEPGVVESLVVSNGSFVEETTLVLTTVDPTKVRFRAMGLQSDLPKFTDGQQVQIVPPQGGSVDLNEVVDSKLSIGVLADPIYRTVPLYAIPSEVKSWTRPGVSAFLEIVTQDSNGIVLAIPRSAVVKDGITHVFFKRDPLNVNKAIRVEADLGVDDGRWIEVKSGLGPKDEVVLDGVYELKLATAQSGTSQKGGHFHADGTFHAEDH